MSATYSPPWYDIADCRLQDLRSIIERDTSSGEYPSSTDVVDRVLLYRGDTVRTASGPAGRELQAELARALLTGPGVLVVRDAFDTDAVDRASTVFNEILDEQRATAARTGDHFGRPGANERIWAAVEKLAARSPDTFVDYFRNEVLGFVATAWLGPHYRVIAEPNVVNPGGREQLPHRDFHMGNMTPAQASMYPGHVHRFSQTLTLQAAVAHCDMPVESGPTMCLPHSQKYGPGYLAVGLRDFQDYFSRHRSQLPLKKGDIMFFNPAVIHAAGANRTADTRRMVNLLQISSAFGRTSGNVNTQLVSTMVYPVLRTRRALGMSEHSLHNVITVCADGWPFPTNLDRNPPIDSLCPESQEQLVWRALESDWTPEQLSEALAEQSWRQNSSLSSEGDACDS